MTEAKDKSPFVTIENLAQYFCVSVSTIRAWVRQGHIPEETYIKLGNTYRFNRDLVSEALTQMRKDDAEQGVETTTAVEATGTVGVVGVETQEQEAQLEFDFDADEDV